MHAMIMRKYLLIVIAFVCYIILLQSTDQARADNTTKVAWIGEKILPKDGAVVKDGKVIVYDGTSKADLSLPWVVQAVDGELLKVGDDKKGWVHMSQVLTVEKAPAYYTEIIAMNRDLGWAYNLRAVAWEELGNTEAAIADYGELLRLAPSATAYNNRGTAWATKKNYTNAIGDYSEAIRLAPNDAKAYCNRGWVFAVRRDFDKAIGDYDQAIRLNSTYAVAYRGRGQAWSAKKEYSKAIADYDQAIRLDPNLAIAYGSRGDALAAMKEYGKAIADCDQAIRLDPNLAPAYVVRGNVRAAMKEYGKAIADLNQAIHGRRDYMKAFNSLARILATCPNAKYRDGARAVSNARKACELSGWIDAEPLDTLAAAFAETGDFNSAVKYQQKAIEHDQNNDVFRGHLAMLRQHKPIREESADTK